MLRNQRDWQSLSYLILQPLLVVWLWRTGLGTLINLALFAMMLFLTLGISVIHHNHTHLRMWHNKRLNRISDFWITLLQGHPTFVFYPAHIRNHHRYHHGPKDVARTYRFGGDSNNLIGYLLHPLQATIVLYPLFTSWLLGLRQRHAGVFYYCLRQYAAVLLLWGILAWLNWQKFLIFVLLPQLYGLHWLLATNYLQHAHADGNSPINFARNFEGWVNPLLFNIGLHTAHHRHPRAHWSALNQLHLQYRDQVDPRLHAGPLLWYMCRSYFLSAVCPRWRSYSLMKPTKES
ncbi:fatty acid desaturase [Iodobacter sp. LRB]|uniref:fatty acid desaturase family protein n=1 Tax=unclassified Iodobacter TaxID=235634 RepID=UPI000C0E2035|nr:fatty acid desaturase [Iodobacter sp. BJB302]PHU99775.1 fatty acid desaturase [Iodobacter sp. BJB302]